MKKYIFLLPLLFGFILLPSCSEPEGTFIEGTIPYFKTKTVGKEVSAADNGKFSVDVYRINPVGVAEITLNLALPEGLSANMFELVSNKASFKDGEYKSSVDVKFDLSKMSVPTVYNLQLAIEDSPRYGFVEPLILSVNKEWVFDKDLGTGSFKSALFGGSWPVEVRGIDGNDGVYQFVDVIEEGYPINFALQGDKIIFKTQETGYIYGTYGIMSVGLAGSDTYEQKGKDITIQLKYTVSAGTVGTVKETFTLP